MVVIACALCIVARSLRATLGEMRLLVDEFINILSLPDEEESEKELE